MIDQGKENKKYLSFKIIQSGELIKVELTSANLKKKFHEILHSLLKELKLKQKEVFLSNDEGKMINMNELNLSLEYIVNKFGTSLRVYSEKIF